jgi:RNA polymerase sigma factor (sigma-70 family)
MIADTELVARSRRRDAEAFGALVERHQRLVVGAALARCGDPALAEDIAQEAFVAAWRDLDRLRDGERVGPWVAGIARNLAASAVRTQARRSAVALEPAWSAPTPEDAALAREDRELLERALADVPAAHRDVLVRYYLGGESVAAIAVALGIREDLVKQRLSRGRRALRESVLARVDSALERARPQRLGGKVLLVMTAKKLAVAAVVVALAIGGATAWYRRGRTSPAPVAATGSTTQPTPTAPAAKVELHVRKLPDPSKRTAMLEAIRERRAQRAGAAGAAGTSAGTSSTPAPSLPAASAPDEEQKDYIRAAVHELIPMLTDCYSEGIERDPKIEGTVVVEFTLEGDPDIGGVVGDSKIDPDPRESTLADAQVRECIQQTMYGLQIDPPKSGLVKVRYPFAFSNQP